MSRAALLALGLLVGCASGPGSSSPPSETPAPAEAHAALEWSPWSPASFERAAAEDRLILINVIASWCHWCHVMEETTYADPEVAALLREHFVVIRVDSDARPDILERYRRWGWPATAFLSPRAEPVLNLRGYRKPELFAALLRELVDEHARGELRRREEPRPEPREQAGGAELERVRAKAAAQLDAYFDPEGLGWGETQKYPWPGPIEYAFVRARLRPGAEGEWRARALATLAAESALIDPVAGGMYQYSLRGVWDRPHYEKIAMIQAGALENHAHAAMITGDPGWLEPARRVAEYLLGTMQDPAGGFYTSQDADLRRADGTGVEGASYYALDDAGRRALGAPRIDTAVYADLNGLMIHGLVELYRASGDRALLEAASRAASRILATHRRESGGLGHGPVAGDGDGAGDGAKELLHLADQAAMGWALLSLHRVSGDPRWLAEARDLAELMVDALAAEDGGFWAHSEDPHAVGVFARRRKPLPENALAAQFLIELHGVLDGDGSAPASYRGASWLDHARAALLAVGGDAQVEARGKVVGRYLVALELLAATKFDLTLVAEGSDGAAEALWQAALKIWDPRVSFERSEPGERYPGLGHAAIYLCSERACSRPLDDPAALARDAERFLSAGL